MTPTEVTAFRRDGAVCLRGLCTDWVEVIAAGIERNMKEPGPHAMESVRPGEPGRFFDDYCNWQRIPEFRRVIEESPIAEAAATAMESSSAQFFHDHVLVKEPGTAKPTPWHQDSPYYFVAGRQTVSFWIPVDPVKEATLRLVAGSHLWDKEVLPVRWLDDTNFYPDPGNYRPVPDPDRDPSMRVMEWEMEPGDAVLFDFRTVHGAHGNPHGRRRRVLSLRWVGDDAAYVERPGRTSPPYPGHDMKAGQKLREDWFPVIWRSRSPDGQSPD
ncbi:MAG TPA: phytanoyl-CoA dioxygenase family protein [Magnetospirillaceae bacterium]|nr:phytanoyl-CoA dioxygenase family protein [Magnetospirillaceae bacterium]